MSPRRDSPVPVEMPQAVVVELEPRRSGEFLPDHLILADELRAEMIRFARADVAMLLLGESGTGKSTLAQFIHAQSPRSGSPFVALNAGLLEGPLLEDTLLGHVRGAFTDAKNDRAGLLKTANGGTLFVDELGSMPPSTQAKLLKVLETGRFMPLGSDQESRTEVRLIAATNEDIGQLCREGRLRFDLLARLTGASFSLKSLRDSPGQLDLLIDHFFKRYASDYYVQSLSDEARILLQRYPWYGNIRELDNAIKNACIRAQNVCVTGAIMAQALGTSLSTLVHHAPVLPPDDGQIDLLSYRPPVPTAVAVPASTPESLADASAFDLRLLSNEGELGATDLAPLFEHIRAQGGLRRALDRVRKRIVMEALKKAGNVTAAAELVGMKRPRLSQIINGRGEKDPSEPVSD